MANVGRLMTINRVLANRESCNKLLEIIIIKIPAPIAACSSLQGLEVYLSVPHIAGQPATTLACQSEQRVIVKAAKKPGGPIRIYYAGKKKMRKALGHSRFQLIVALNSLYAFKDEHV